MPREQSTANLKSRIADATYELIPIDHGFCLPETLEAPYFEWLHWPQAMLPFSEAELAYIRRLDIEVRGTLLNTLSWLTFGAWTLRCSIERVCLPGPHKFTQTCACPVPGL